MILCSSAPGNVGKAAPRKAVKRDDLNPSTTPCHKSIAPMGKDVPSSLRRKLLTILGKLWDKEGNILASWRITRNSCWCSGAWSSSHTKHELCKEGLAVHCCIRTPGLVCSCEHQCCAMYSIHPSSWVLASFLMPRKRDQSKGWRPAHLQFSTCGYTVFLRSLHCVSSNPGLPRSGHVPNAARQVHFEVGVLVLLQQAVQEEECFPLMFISCEHCRPRLELISCVDLCKNRKYILPTFQML